MKRLHDNWLRALPHAGALVPLLVLGWDAVNDRLTFNPIQEATHRTGKSALILLLLSLAITPATVILGLKQLRPLRRPLGLYAFFYAALHLFIFVVVDYGLQFSFIWQELAEKRYVLAGFTAFLLLVPLAVTSTQGWQRRLKRRWVVLHRLVYVAAPFAIVHYVWLVKADSRKPLLYAAALSLLFVLRIPPVRRLLTRLRTRLTAQREATGPMPPPASAGE